MKGFLMNEIKKFNIRVLPMMILLMILLILSGCGQQAEGPEEKGTIEIRIAEQFGIAYAPLQIMREQGLIEKELPGAVVT